MHTESNGFFSNWHTPYATFYGTFSQLSFSSWSIRESFRIYFKIFTPQNARHSHHIVRFKCILKVWPVVARLYAIYLYAQGRAMVEETPCRSRAPILTVLLSSLQPSQVGLHLFSAPHFILARAKTDVPCFHISMKSVLSLPLHTMVDALGILLIDCHLQCCQAPERFLLVVLYIYKVACDGSRSVHSSRYNIFNLLGCT